jgi:hypothetical protein
MMGSNVNGSNGVILTGTLIGAGFGLKGMSDQQAKATERMALLRQQEAQSTPRGLPPA